MLESQSRNLGNLPIDQLQDLEKFYLSQNPNDQAGFFDFLSSFTNRLRKVYEKDENGDFYKINTTHGKIKGVKQDFPVCHL